MRRSAKPGTLVQFRYRALLFGGDKMAKTQFASIDSLFKLNEFAKTHNIISWQYSLTDDGYDQWLVQYTATTD